MVGKWETERDICCLQMFHNTASHQHAERKPFVFILLTGFSFHIKFKTRWLGSSNCSCMCMCMCMHLKRVMCYTCSLFCFTRVEGHGAAVRMVSLFVWSVLEPGAFDDSTLWVEWFFDLYAAVLFSLFSISESVRFFSPSRFPLYLLSLFVCPLPSVSQCLFSVCWLVSSAFDRSSVS